jgi:hypothetical protein
LIAVVAIPTSVGDLEYLPTRVIAGYSRSPTDVGMATTAIKQIGAASGSHGKSVLQTVLLAKPKAAPTNTDIRLTLI